MAKVSVFSKLAAPAERVWDVIGPFDSISDWHPAIEKSVLESEGKLRLLWLAGGGRAVDQLVVHDDDKRFYRYFSIETPLPVAEFAGKVSVNIGESGAGSIIECSANFAPIGLSETDSIIVIKSVYEAGLENIRIILGE